MCKLLAAAIAAATVAAYSDAFVLLMGDIALEAEADAEAARQAPRLLRQEPGERQGRDECALRCRAAARGAFRRTWGARQPRREGRQEGWPSEQRVAILSEGVDDGANGRSWGRFRRRRCARSRASLLRRPPPGL